jgi:hypothetical protein
MPHIAGADYHEAQHALFRKVLPEDDLHEVVPCRRNYAWTFKPEAQQCTFDNLSVQPSLDASPAGHWHGHITNGEIVGGI